VGVARTFCHFGGRRVGWPGVGLVAWVAIREYCRHARWFAGDVCVIGTGCVRLVNIRVSLGLACAFGVKILLVYWQHGEWHVVVAL